MPEYLAPGLFVEEIDGGSKPIEGVGTKTAAFIYPWIKIADPVNKGQQIFVPPSGHMAGVWARVGSERGVHKAPANEAVMGAVGMEVQVTKGEQEILNPNGHARPHRGGSPAASSETTCCSVLPSVSRARHESAGPGTRDRRRATLGGSPVVEISAGARV